MNVLYLWFPENFEQACDTLAADFHIEKGSEREEPAFSLENSLIHFEGKDIEISGTKNSDPHYLLAVIFKDIKKVWAYDEIWETSTFNLRAYDPKKDWRKIYNAARSVNEKVAMATTISDLLVITKTEVSVNHVYLNS